MCSESTSEHLKERVQELLSINETYKLKIEKLEKKNKECNRQTEVITHSLPFIERT